MKNDPAWIYAQLAPPPDDWVDSPSPSYDAADLRAEYRRRYYSLEAVAMIEAFDESTVAKVREAVR